jgi:ABC-type transport system involved in multi-copper enzyme maturation permease subunit
VNPGGISLLLAQSEKVTSWLTPVWILSTGLAIGFVLVLGIWGLLLLLGKSPLVNRLNDRTGTRVVAGLVLSGIIFGLLYWFSSGLGFWSPEGLSSGERNNHLFIMAVFYGGGSLLAGFGLVAAVSGKRHDDLQQAPRDGFLYWTSLVCIVAAGFSLVGYGLAKTNGFGVLVPVQDPDALLRSAAALPFLGEDEASFTVPLTTPEEGVPVPGTRVDGRRLAWVQIRTNQPVDVASRPMAEDVPPAEIFRVEYTNEFVIDPNGPNNPRYPDEVIPSFYVTNRGTAPAEMLLRWKTEPEVPQAWLLYWAAGSVIVLYLGYLLFVAAFPKIYAVAQSTFKTEISQPVFLILLIIGVLFSVGSIYIPYNTFGEDIKMYKDSGLTLLRVLGIFLAVWAASKSLAEEIEGRTALTVLSKPVSRRQFILGKYSGIGLALALLFIALGIWFFIWVAYKPIYDSRESSVREYDWPTCFREGIHTIPGVVLAWLEAMVFAAISVVISTRLGILANFMICFAIYVVGHLTPLIVQSSEVAKSFEAVVVFGQVISIIFPVLDHYDINAAITGDVTVPIAYLGWATLYTALYGFIALLLALVLFEDRDLA